MTQEHKEHSLEALEEKYNDIAALYDLAEDLVSTVESDLVKDQEAQLQLVEPLIHEIGEATDVLAEEFTLLAEQNKKRKSSRRANKTHIEGAMRRIFTAVHEYQVRAKAAGKKAFNIADAVVQKIQRQAEKVLSIFMEFIQLSLLNLMGKAELEALRVRNTDIAMLMHQQAMQQQHQS